MNLMPIFQAVVFPGALFIIAMVLFTMWYERKLIAKIHLRIGPQYVGRTWGALQTTADVLKLLSKEIIVPDRSEKLLFMLMPSIALIIVAIPLAVIPFAPDFYVTTLGGVELIVILAIGTIIPEIALITGWISANKYSIMGGIRAMSQLIAFEIPLWFSAASVILLAHSLSLMEITHAQSQMWFIFLAPIGFIIFFIASLAEMERIPFDAPEAKEEVVYGWLTEYGGLNYGIFLIAKYVQMFVGACLIVILFLGGFNGHSIFPPILWFFLKVFIVITLFILARGILYRFRIDQILKQNWQVIVPLSILNIFLTVALLYSGLLSGVIP